MVAPDKILVELPVNCFFLFTLFFDQQHSEKSLIGSLSHCSSAKFTMATAQCLDLVHFKPHTKLKYSIFYQTLLMKSFKKLLATT